jgi:hypothetical protein
VITPNAPNGVYRQTNTKSNDKAGIKDILKWVKDMKEKTQNRKV